MVIKNQEDIIRFITEDEWMMDILRAVETINLPDWWICAGFVRSKIWDVQHNFSDRTPLPDIDVIYFDRKNIDIVEEKRIENQLITRVPYIPWSVKNQARMHVKCNLPPYASSVDGISTFPETATALGVKLDQQGAIMLTAPWGIDDVVNLEVRPTPMYDTKERIGVYENRVSSKNWHQIWSRVKIFEIN